MIRALLVAVLLLTVWLAAGRQITLLLDRVPFPATSLPVSPIRYEGGGIVVGGITMVFAGTSNQPLPIGFALDPTNRAVATWGQDSVVLGPRAGPVKPSGRPPFDFTAEDGDEVAFTRRASPVSWPTPFEFKILGGKSPWWRRYVYYRLVWKKRSGARLEMAWRYEQQYYSGTGWSKPDMMWDSRTGLLSVQVQVESAGAEGSVVRYLARTKGWHRRDYRIEDRGSAGDGQHTIFAVMHQEDENCAAPGAGKSVQLYLDARSYEVTKEMGGQ